MHISDEDDIDYGWWLKTDAVDMKYSGILSSDDKDIDCVNNLDHMFRNKIGRTVYLDYMKCKVGSEMENTIASLARVDVWITLCTRFAVDDWGKVSGFQQIYKKAQENIYQLQCNSYVLA